MSGQNVAILAVGALALFVAVLSVLFDRLRDRIVVLESERESTNPNMAEVQDLHVLDEGSGGGEDPGERILRGVEHHVIHHDTEDQLRSALDASRAQIIAIPPWPPTRDVRTLSPEGEVFSRTGVIRIPPGWAARIVPIPSTAEPATPRPPAGVVRRSPRNRLDDHPVLEGVPQKVVTVPPQPQESVDGTVVLPPGEGWAQ